MKHIKVIAAALVIGTLLWGCGNTIEEVPSTAPAAATTTPTAEPTTEPATPEPTMAPVAITYPYPGNSFALDEFVEFLGTGEPGETVECGPDDEYWDIWVASAVVDKTGRWAVEMMVWTPDERGYYTIICQYEDQPDTAATIEVLWAAPDPTAEPTPTAHKVGDAISVAETDDPSNEATYTITKVKNFTSRNMFVEPDRGNKFIAVEVLVVGVSGSLELSSFDFEINDKDGYVYEKVPNWAEPEFPYDVTTKPGKKTRGWITFEVPKGLKSGVVAFYDIEVQFKVK